MTTDELDKFFVDENEPINKKELADLIEDFIYTIGRNGVIEFKEDFETMPDWRKTAVFLLCRKIMMIKGVIEDEKIGPKEIADTIHISESSARDVVSRNPSLQKIVSKENSRYFIPNYKIKKLKEILKNG